MIRKSFIQKDGSLICRATFTLPSSFWADTIHLVGDFNSWSTTSLPFGRGWDGSWTLTLDLECGRSYQFRYLVDGRDWTNDGQADAYVANPYGTDNCVLIAEPPPELDAPDGRRPARRHPGRARPRAT